MIISHRHQFIFVKTSKTAGTSVEMALSAVCGDTDVLTPLGTSGTEAARREIAGRGSQHYLIPMHRWDLRDWARVTTNPRKWSRVRPQFYNHASSKEIRRRVSDSLWSNYCRFCIVRNPYDRIVSLYYWKRRHQPTLTWDDFIASGQASEMRSKSWDMYTIDGQLAVSRVVRYESLMADLQVLAVDLGLDRFPELPRRHANTRSDSRPLQESLPDIARRFVEAECAEELELFDYRLVPA